MARHMECPSTGKRIFWNERTVCQAATKAGRHNVLLSHYKCKACSYWHLATRRKKSTENRRNVNDVD